jgi:DMSO/TMAO reductase YedYZ molybdopterin-dependent catalytic subunit
MPVTSWIDDRTPPEQHRTTLKVGGRVVDSDELWALARTVTADLDCTGGWWSRQDWDAVDLATVLGPVATRSVRVVSATGYQRLVPASQLDRFHLAVGYGGRPLLAGHGAPVRLIAPGRRGPWWVKWVVEVTPDDRPAWLQPPFPVS